MSLFYDRGSKVVGESLSVSPAGRVSRPVNPFLGRFGVQYGSHPNADYMQCHQSSLLSLLLPPTLAPSTTYYSDWNTAMVKYKRINHILEKY
jgi:hypothetical protein